MQEACHTHLIVFSRVTPALALQTKEHFDTPASGIFF
jgi:hypothetical protein